MRIRTKLVCTMGPACSTLDKVIAMIEAGMSVARLNFSHGTHDDHAHLIATLKEAREKTGQPLAIMLDTKGPEIRVGHLPEPRTLQKGDIITLVPGMVSDSPKEIPVVPEGVLEGLPRGTTILFDDGYIESEVIDETDEGVKVQIHNEGILKAQKGINIPGAELNLDLVTENDIRDIRFGCKHDVDMVAASFVQGPEQILQIKKLLVEEGRPDTQVVAKIETRRGVDNFDKILEVVDGIMIARGDLGVEMPLAQVPGLQKMMIRECYGAGKPSIVATQMLESMMVNPRPTRAEASDVANGIFDSASAVMLSGETAAGKYPVETVKTMRAIVAEAERVFDYEDFFFRQVRTHDTHDVPSSVSLAALRTAFSAEASAILCVSSSGRTPRLVSRLRPGVPILVLTTSRKVYHQLAFSWGVVPIHCDKCSSMEQAYELISSWALENDYVKYGDLVVFTAGVPFGIAGTTNMMIVESIGNVAVRGHGGYGRRVMGTVAIVYDTAAAIKGELSDRVVVLTRCSEETLPLLKRSRAVILQNSHDDYESERYLLLMAKALNLPVIVGGDSATQLLKEDETVTVEPQNFVVYRGEVEIE